MVTRHFGSNMIDAGLSRQPMSVGGCIYSKSNFTALALAANSEVVGLSIPIPAGVINAKNTGLRVRSYWTAGSGGGNKTMRYRMTDETGQLLAAALFTTTDIAAVLDMDLMLIDESSGQWESYAFGLCAPAVLDGGRATDTDDIRGAWVLAVTIENATANDLTLRGVRVDVLREGGVSA